MGEPPPSPFRADVPAERVAFVTGGATGIGKEICGVLGHHGARIAIASRKREALVAAAAELAAEGIETHVDSCDVRDAAEVQCVVAGIVGRFGRLDMWWPVRYGGSGAGGDGECSCGRVQEELKAVGVHDGVVAFAEQDQVGEVGAATGGPSLEVVGVQPAAARAGRVAAVFAVDGGEQVASRLGWFAAAAAGIVAGEIGLSQPAQAETGGQGQLCGVGCLGWEQFAVG
jgi:hypothetical protein